MLGMNTLLAKEPVETAPEQWPVEIGEQMAAAHRIYPVLDKAADLRLAELLRVAEESRTPDRERKRDRLPCTEQDERDGERKHGVPD
jgi:hypothetical protein